MNIVQGFGKRTLATGLLAGALSGIGGCVIRAEPAPAYYYRTRLVYTANGPVYVRERVYYRPYGAPPVYDAPPPEGGPYPPAAGAYPPPGAQAPESPAVAQLHPLVAPIALYPDPLIAVLLPATTFPQQLQDANAFLAAYPPPPQSAIDYQPWEPSVKAIAHYPTVLKQLVSDMQWTQSLGSAFTAQPSDVMTAIQDMRAQAAAQGNLVSTPQQTVVQDGGIIAIEPANPDTIYLPTYDPVTVYVGYHPLYFGTVGFGVGPWFVNGVYWGGGAIFVGDWHGGYYFREGHWGRDYAWRADAYHHWERDSRFGPAPHIDRAHYEYAHDVRGREADIHRGMTEHAQQRHEVQHYSARPGNAGRAQQHEKEKPHEH
jgi:hypothetical protein